MSIKAALRTHLADHDLDARVATLIARAVSVPGLADRFTRAGLDPQDVRGVADLTSLPVLPKDAVIAQQAQDPPFGGLLAPDARVARVFQSPGPLYEPQLVGDDYWRWGQVFTDLGVGAEDTVLNCFGHHLSPAGAMMEAGAHAAGATVVPGGIGSQDLQVRAIADLGVSAYCGLPSYLKVLIERFDEQGLPADRWRLEKAMVTAEPLPDSLRGLLTERVATVRMAYGTGETGLLAYENGDGHGLALADGVLVQVCDPTGTPVEDETEGEVVVTVLRPQYPLVRFGTGDRSGWTTAPDGSLRLRGVLGRTGAAVKVKGMFLHPSQAATLMSGIEGVTDYRFVIGREDHVDTLRCEIVPTGGGDPTALAALTGQVAQRVREGLRFRAEVVAVSRLTPGDGPLLDERDWD
ncbi:phenylacetate--CoA ligase family protein [Janibacter cremeus]|uniref:Phenylacetate-CoA ligase n=1 Tax=Janibacter cremeus TaxID=1285192 RepID=A0A852VQK7_9MICO|nr:AMP-binding protein [Janibacter cremeus]NYF99317.1 phenylacetate-CoA ligase [Janibacter cremeus]